MANWRTAGEDYFQEPCGRVCWQSGGRELDFWHECGLKETSENLNGTLDALPPS